MTVPERAALVRMFRERRCVECGKPADCIAPGDEATDIAEVSLCCAHAIRPEQRKRAC